MIKVNYLSLILQWFLIILFVIEAGAKVYLNRDHQFGIVEDHDLYDQISQDQRGCPGCGEVVHPEEV